MLKQALNNSSFSNAGSLTLKLSNESHQPDKKSPNSSKDLRRLVLDKARNQDSPILNGSPRYEDKKHSPIQNEFSFDFICPIKQNSPSAISIRNQQKQQLIKEILLTNEPIQLENQLHNDTLLQVMKKTIRNKEEIHFIQHFLKNQLILEMDQDFNTPGESNLSEKIYPYVSYSFFNKGEAIYNSGEFSFNYYIILKGNVAQYNDNYHQSPQMIKRCYDSQNKLKVQRLSLLMNNCSPQSLQKKVQLNRSLEQDQKNIQLEDIIQLPNKVLEKYFSQGQGFGDIEIMTNQTRSSTMICIEDTHLLTISKEGFDQVFVKYRRSQISEKLAFFKQHSFFNNIPDSRILNLINSGKKISFMNKQVIFSEGDLVDSIYFIINGEVSISSIHDKRRINLQILGQNNFFGFDEIANYNKPSNSREIKVVSNSNELILMVFNIQKFMKFLINYKQFEHFLGDCRARLKLRKQIAEKIINTQNILQTENENQSKRMKEYENEIKNNILQKLKIPVKRSSQLHQKNIDNQEQTQQIQFNPIGKLEQIVNAREEIFNTLDRQQKIKKYKQNKKYMSVEMAPASQNLNSNDSFGVYNKKLNSIFENQSKDFIFDQSYYCNQERKIGKNNKSMLELKQQIETQINGDGNKKKKQLAFIGSLESITQRHIPNVKDIFENRVKSNKILDDGSQSMMHVNNTPSQSTSNKFLKNFLQKKKLQVKFQNFEHQLQQHQTQQKQRMNSCDELSHHDSHFHNKIQEAQQNQSSVRFLDKLSPNTQEGQNKEYKAVKMLKQLRKARTNVNISKFFETSPLEQSIKEGINNFQVISMPSPQAQTTANHQDDHQKETSFLILDQVQPSSKTDSPIQPSNDSQRQKRLDQFKRQPMDRQLYRSQVNIQLINKRPRFEKQKTQQNFSHMGYQTDNKSSYTPSNFLNKKACKSSQLIHLPNIEDSKQLFSSTQINFQS